MDNGICEGHSRQILPIDLQLFANGDEEDREIPPTQRKIQRARSEGHVPRSQELTVGFVLLILSLLLIPWASRYAAPRLANMLKTTIVAAFENRVVDQDTALKLLRGVFPVLLSTVAPILIVGALAGVFSNVVQFGFLFTLRPVVPNLGRINPLAGIRRIFSLKEFLQTLVKVLLKGALVVWIIYSFASKKLVLVPSLFGVPPAEVLDIYVDWWKGLQLRVAGALFVIGVADAFYQRYRYTRGLYMTREEFKEEMKSHEMPPEVKRRIRSRHIEILRRALRKTVRNADVVVTNPTHVAVAIEVREIAEHGGSFILPYVVAKGLDEAAQVIIELAKEFGIPIYRDPPLAWELYRTVRVGDVIPSRFWRAVARILVAVGRVPTGVR